jgi:dienelactone hydrolase
MSNLEALTIADISVLLRSPTHCDRSAPLILLWHGFGTPNTEAALAEVLPLDGVQAWKAYLGLPQFGQLLRDNPDELMRRQLEDYVLKLLLPIIEQAMQKLPSVVEALRSHCNIDPNTGIGLFGFSAGGLATLLTLAESNLPIQAAVLAGATKDLSVAVDTYERILQATYSSLKEKFPWVKPTYSWSKESEAAKVRLDFVARAKEIVRGNPPPAVLFVHGAQDDVWSVRDVETLYDSLMEHYRKTNYPERLSMQVFQHLGHPIDLAAAKTSPQIQADIAAMERAIANWFTQHLVRELI